MRKKKINIKTKPIENVSYHKELHHTCLSSQICLKEIQPCKKCEGCKYYSLQEVDVADSLHNFSLDWGF